MHTAFTCIEMFYFVACKANTLSANIRTLFHTVFVLILFFAGGKYNIGILSVMQHRISFALYRRRGGGRCHSV